MNPPNSHVNIRIYNTDICQLEKMRNHLAFGHRIWKRNYINMNEWFKIYVYQETRFAAKLWEKINIIT